MPIDPEQNLNPPYARARLSVHGLEVVMFDGSTAVIHEDRIARHTAHPETFLATLQIKGPSRNVRGFLSIDNRMLQEPEIDTDLQNALRDYCANTVPPDDFLLCARATGKKHGIEFIEMRPAQMIC